MRQVYQAADPLNAEIIKDFLIGHGIEAQVRGDMLWGGRGDLPADTTPSVWVAVESHARACELVRQMEQGHATANAWRCSHCGEPLAGQFTHCWNCGQPRP